MLPFSWLTPAIEHSCVICFSVDVAPILRVSYHTASLNVILQLCCQRKGLCTLSALEKGLRMLFYTYLVSFARWTQDNSECLPPTRGRMGTADMKEDLGVWPLHPSFRQNGSPRWSSPHRQSLVLLHSREVISVFSPLRCCSNLFWRVSFLAPRRSFQLPCLELHYNFAVGEGGDFCVRAVGNRAEPGWQVQ